MFLKEKIISLCPKFLIEVYGKTVNYINKIIRRSAAYKKCSEKYGVSKRKIKRAFTRDREKYGVVWDDFYYFGFCVMPEDQKKEYVTRRTAEYMAEKYNSVEYRCFFDDKKKFSEKFSNYLNRRVIFTDGMQYDDFVAFSEGLTKIIYKPNFGSKGAGICVFRITQESLPTIYEKIILFGSGVVEEWIVQHEEITQMYPDAVNPIRVNTVVKNGEVFFFGATLTLGKKEEFANASNDALFALIDSDSGIVITDLFDYQENSYREHPISGAVVKSVSIPHWKQVRELLDAAARVVPQVGYVGWDVAVTQQGASIIEGNATLPGYTAWQMKNVTGKGTMNIFKKFLD